MSFDIFDLNGNEEGAKPLAERMRANNLNEFVGQKHIVSEGSLLRRAIATDRLGSCIFFGPPGTGKTTLANIIASTTHGEFIKLNAVQAGVADVKKAVEEARTISKCTANARILCLTSATALIKPSPILSFLQSKWGYCLCTPVTKYINRTISLKNLKSKRRRPRSKRDG